MPSTALNRFMQSRLPRLMAAVGIVLTAHASNLLDVQYPPASQPGHAPAKRTGNLQAGLDHSEHIVNGDEVTTIKSSRGGDDPLIPTYLEFGTSNTDKTQRMAPRPYMRPTMNSAEPLLITAAHRTFNSEATDYESGS